MELFLGIVFGSIGGVYVFLARREHSALYLVIGALLILFPYFVSGVPLTIVIGVALSIVPVAVNRGWV
jgi:hypothetical protein